MICVKHRDIGTETQTWAIITKNIENKHYKSDLYTRCSMSNNKKVSEKSLDSNETDVSQHHKCLKASMMTSRSYVYS
jgi:hypothetical protein